MAAFGLLEFDHGPKSAALGEDSTNWLRNPSASALNTASCTTVVKMIPTISRSCMQHWFHRHWWIHTQRKKRYTSHSYYRNTPAVWELNAMKCTATLPSVYGRCIQASGVHRGCPNDATNALVLPDRKEAKANKYGVGQSAMESGKTIIRLWYLTGIYIPRIQIPKWNRGVVFSPRQA